MKNILSYSFGTPFSGKEIKEWAEFQVDNKTSHYKEGLWLLSKRMKDTRLYYFSKDVYSLYYYDKRRKMPYFKRFPLNTSLVQGRN